MPLVFIIRPLVNRNFFIPFSWGLNKIPAVAFNFLLEVVKAFMKQGIYFIYVIIVSLVLGIAGWFSLNEGFEDIFIEKTYIEPKIVKYNSQEYVPGPNPFEEKINVCDRTPRVRNAILESLPYAASCDRVNPDWLKTVNSLKLRDAGITGLKQGDFDNLTNLQELHLGSNQLKSLPEYVFDDLGNLDVLYLSNNDLSVLPQKVFFNLPNMESLDLSGNRFSSLPSGIFSLSLSLETLDLSGNRFSSFPNDIFPRFPNPNFYSNGSTPPLPVMGLKTLDISSNNLTFLTDNVFDNLIILEKLDLSRNNLSSLPPRIFENLLKLEILDLTQNKLSCIPRNSFGSRNDDFSKINLSALLGTRYRLPPGVSIYDIKPNDPRLQPFEEDRISFCTVKT